MKVQVWVTKTKDLRSHSNPLPYSSIT